MQREIDGMSINKDKIRKINALKRKQSIEVSKAKDAYGESLKEQRQAQQELDDLNSMLDNFLGMQRERREKSKIIDPLIEQMYQSYFSELDEDISTKNNRVVEVEELNRKNVEILYKKNAEFNLYEKKEAEFKTEFNKKKMKEEYLDSSRESSVKEAN